MTVSSNNQSELTAMEIEVFAKSLAAAKADLLCAQSLWDELKPVLKQAKAAFRLEAERNPELKNAAARDAWTECAMTEWEANNDEYQVQYAKCWQLLVDATKRFTEQDAIYKLWLAKMGSHH